jgi:hypothetical protein
VSLLSLDITVCQVPFIHPRWCGKPQALQHQASH